MVAYDTLLQLIPEVKGPTQKHLSFRQKLKWTGMILLLFFILGAVPLFGLGDNALAQFEYLSVVLGASFGSIISLGIGPIVTASIVLQLLNGAGILSFDLSSHAGKSRFQGTQKLLTYFFIVLEAAIYVLMGGLSPSAGIPSVILILQLVIGGILIVFLDDVINKWGFGSGTSLFIAAGVSQQIFIQAFSWLKAGAVAGASSSLPTGAVPRLFVALSSGLTSEVSLALGSIISTLLIFGVVVFAQSMKVEIPLSFGRIRGHGIRWPLNFVYTNVIPVILVSALVANIQMFGSLLANKGHSWLNAVVPFITNPNLLDNIAKKTIADNPMILVHSFTYVLFFVILSVVFSYFWMQTSGLDPKSQARQMMNSGLQIPGFRKDARVLERLLKKYIYPLTIMGGIFIGLLASIANMTGAFGSGTGLLLTVMIIYKLYEDIAKQHMEDMNPALRKMMGR